MSWINILKTKEPTMKEEFFNVIRREYKNMKWADEFEGKPTIPTEEGYPEFFIENVEREISEGGNIVDIIISEIKENEIIMDYWRQDDPKRAKYIQNFINELKRLLV